MSYYNKFAGHLKGAGVTFPNAFSWDGNGVDKRLEVNDNNNISFGDGAGNDSPFSVGGYIKADSHAGGFTIWSKGLNTSREYALLVTATHRVRGVCSNPTGSAEIVIQSSSTYAADIGAYHHYCLTYAGTKLFSGLALYRDGILIAATNQSSGVYAGMTNGTGKVFMANTFGIAGTYADGKLAHPALFDKALSAAEVLEVYNKKMGDLRTTSVGANIISAYNFPNGQADYPTMNDYGGGGNHATMINGLATDINTDVPT